MTACHGAGKGAANANMIFPRGASAESGVKRDHFHDLNRLQTEFFSGPSDAIVADETKVMLEEMKDGEHRTPFGNGVVGNDFIDLGDQFGWQFHGSFCGRRVEAVQSILRSRVSGKAIL